MNIFIDDGATGATDPDFANVLMLLHMDGTDEGTTFVDSGPLGLAISRGNVVTDAGAAKFGTAGGRWDTFSSTGYVSATSPPAATFKPLHDGSNWTWEGWTKFSSRTGTQGLFGNASSTASIGIAALLSNRDFRLQVYYGSVGNLIVNGTASNAYPDDSNWHFIRVTCDFGLGSNNYKVYIDDMTTPVGQFSKTGNTPSSANPTYAPFYTGSYGSAGGPAGPLSNGNMMDDVRITANVVRTGAAPSAAFPDA